MMFFKAWARYARWSRYTSNCKLVGVSLVLCHIFDAFGDVIDDVTICLILMWPFVQYSFSRLLIQSFPAPYPDPHSTSICIGVPTCYQPAFDLGTGFRSGCVHWSRTIASSLPFVYAELVVNRLQPPKRHQPRNKATWIQSPWRISENSKRFFFSSW